MIRNEILERRPLDIPAVAALVMLPLMRQRSANGKTVNARHVYRHMKDTLPAFRRRLCEPEMRTTYVLEELVIHLRDSGFIAPVDGERWGFRLTPEGIRQTG